MLKMFRESLKLNIWDLNYISSNPKTIERRLLAGKANFPRKGFFIRVGSFFWHYAQSCLNILFKPQKQMLVDAVWLFANTSNQANILLPLQNKVEKAVFIWNGKPYQEGLPFPAFWAYFLALPFFPYTLMKFLIVHDSRKTNLLYEFDQYWLTYGYYIISRLWFRRYCPRALVVSNDHSMVNRVIVKAATDEEILTIYLQHASVTDEFPPLDFDYALLEGEDALRTYDRLGDSKTIVFLVGALKLDIYFTKLNDHSIVSSIGVCTNLFDNVSRVEELCRTLRKEFPDRALFLRPHPADKRKSTWQRLTEKYLMTLSTSHIETSFDFLQHVDVILAGNSNIHLEAVLLNVFSIFYDFSQEPGLIKYSFIERGLSEYKTNPVAVVDLLKTLSNHKPDVRQKAKAYCATVGTVYDGHSSELASAIINQVISVGHVNMSKWKRIPGVELEAYEPVPSSNSSINNSLRL